MFWSDSPSVPLLAFRRLAPAALSLATLVLTGCVNLAPDYERPAPSVPASFTAVSEPVTPRAETPEGWKRFFSDPELVTLIDRALKNNPDLKIAELARESARQTLKATGADRFPAVTGDGAQTNDGIIDGGGPVTRSYSVSLGLSFTLDFFGRIRNLTERELHTFLAAQSAADTARITLISNVSQNYFEYLYAVKSRRLAEETLASYEMSLALITAQQATGGATALAAAQMRSQTEAARADLEAKKTTVMTARNALAVLTGDFTSGIPAVNNLTLSGVKIPENLASSVLLARPDVAEAEHKLQAAYADIGAARAAFFPEITLTGSLGSRSDALSGLFDAGTGFWSWGPSVNLPLFDAGKNNANLALAEISRDSAVENYQKTIQTAFKEVSDALVSRTGYLRQIAQQKRYIASVRETLLRAQLLYEAGAASFMDVLDAQRSLYSARLTLLTLQKKRETNEVVLYAALGGGLRP